MGNSPPTAFVPVEPSGIEEPCSVEAVENTSLDKNTVETNDLSNDVKVENAVHSGKESEIQPSDATTSAEPSQTISSALDTNACAATTSADAVAAAAAAVLANFSDAFDPKPSGSAVAPSPTPTSNSSGSRSSSIPSRRGPRGHPSKRGRGSSNWSAGARTNAASNISTKIVQPIPSFPVLPTEVSLFIPVQTETLPKVDSVPTSLRGEQPPPKPFVGVGKPEVVRVVHIKSPSSFYVHRDQDKIILEDLQKFLDTCPEREHPPLNSVSKGQMYICKFLVDDKWYRVTIKSCTAMLNPPESRDAIADIFYVDYGNSDRVPLSRLRPLPVQVKNVPPYALHCSLFDLHPREGNVWPEEAHRTFCKMVNGVRVHMNVMSFKDDVYNIDLCAIPGMKYSNFPVSVRDAMVFMDLAYLEDESRLNIRQSSARFDSEYLKEESLSKGEHFPVVLSHIESPSEFYAQRRGTHAEYLSKLLDEMSQFYKNNCNDMIYDPGVGMPCAAQFSLDKSWYRARVMSIPKKSWVQVFYVDYGNREEIPYTNIRKMPEKFMRIPPQAIECTLADVMPTRGNSWPITATKFFLSVTKDKELRLLVEDVSKPCTKVVLYEEKDDVDICLNALLVNEGHALSIGVGSSLVEYPKVEAAVPAETYNGVPVQFETVKPSRKKVRKTRKVDRGGVGVLEDKEYLPGTNTSRGSTKGSVNTGPPFSVPVTIVMINTPGCVYVRPCSIEEDIANLIHDMQVYYSGMTINETEWKEADKCAVCSKKENKWLRASILEMFDNTAKVFYKDMAVTETVPLSNLRVLHENFARIHDGALRCHLAGIQAAGGQKWSSVACEMFCDLLQKTYSDLFITKKGEIEENSLPIELWARDIVSPGPLEPNRVDWISLNQVLVERGMAIPTTMPETLEIMEAGFCSPSLDSVATSADIYSQGVDEKSSSMSSDESTSSEEVSRQELLLCPENPRRQWLPPVPLKTRHFVGMVTSVDSQCVIHLHNIEDSETLAVIKDAATSFVGNSKPKPQDLYWFEGQICLVQFHVDKFWYRGRIIQAKENNMYEVLFVDYGNIELCGVELLRKDVIMTHIPIKSRAYQLDEIQPADCDGKWKIEHLDFLHATVDGKRCKVIIKSSIEDEIPKISLILPGNIDVAQLLVSMHYALYSSNVINSYAASEEGSEDVIIDNIEEISELSDSNAEKVLKNTDEPKISEKIKQIESSENASVSSEKVDKGASRNEDSAKDVGSDTIVTDKYIESTEIESQLCSNEFERKPTIIITDKLEVSDSTVSQVTKVETDSTALQVVKIETVSAALQVVNLETDNTASQVAKIETDNTASSLVAKIETGVEVSETKLITEPVVLELSDEEKSVSMKNCEVDTGDIFQKDDQVLEEKIDKEKEKINRSICENSNDAIENSFRLGEEKEVMEAAKISKFINETVDVKYENYQEQVSSIDEDYILWSEAVQDLEDQKKNFLFESLNLENCDTLSVQVTILMDSLTEIVMIPERSGNEEIVCRDDFDLMALEIQNEAAYLPVLEVPYVGQVCCAQYFEDEQYYRAIIVEVEEGNSKVRVEFVDYGNVEWLYINRVHQIKPTWMSIPAQAIRCQLWNLKIAEECDRRVLLKEMSKLIFNQSLTAKIKKKNPLAVELYSGNSEELVYKQLLDSGLLIQISEEESEEKY